MCNKALRSKCLSKAVLRDLLVAVMVRTGRYAPSLQWHLQQQEHSPEELLQLLQGCSTYPSGWDHYLLGSHLAYSRGRHASVPSDGLLRDCGGNILCNASAEQTIHLSECTRAFSDIVYCRRRGLQRETGSAGGEIGVDCVEDLSAGTISGNTGGGAVGGGTVRACFLSCELDSSDCDTICYPGLALGGDRVAVAGDPLPHFADARALSIDCAPGEARLGPFTRVAWQLPPGFVPSTSAASRDTVVECGVGGCQSGVDGNCAMRVEYPEAMVPTLVRSHVAYFEVTVLETDRKPPENQAPCIAVGLCLEGFPLKQFMPGWGSQSVGYHSDDGQLHYGMDTVGLWPARPFGAGDTVGCGVVYPPLVGDAKGHPKNLALGSIFFTLNGRVFSEGMPLLDFYAFDEYQDLALGDEPWCYRDLPTGGLYPCVVSSGVCERVFCVLCLYASNVSAVHMTYCHCAHICCLFMCAGT
jgi:hypothetical protein